MKYLPVSFRLYFSLASLLSGLVSHRERTKEFIIPNYKRIVVLESFPFRTCASPCSCMSKLSSTCLTGSITSLFFFGLPCLPVTSMNHRLMIGPPVLTSETVADFLSENDSPRLCLPVLRVLVSLKRKDKEIR